MSGIFENIPNFPKAPSFFEAFQAKPDMIARRIKSGRNPSTGMMNKGNSMSPLRPSTAATGPTYAFRPDTAKHYDPSKLNARVIEGWINSTLTDAEYLDIPGCLTKPEKKLPMVRFGIDRATLVVTFT
jgi:hypothetical protein